MPVFVVSAVEVAITTRFVALSSAATARMPPALLTVPELPPLTNQVTAWAGLFSPLTVAVKAWVPPFATLAVAGLTVTDVTVGSPPPGSGHPVRTRASVTVIKSTAPRNRKLLLVFIKILLIFL
jgi:hypothetical protein